MYRFLHAAPKRFPLQSDKMAASYDSDEEDDYVTLGTPLTPYEEGYYD